MIELVVKTERRMSRENTLWHLGQTDSIMNTAGASMPRYT